MSDGDQPDIRLQKVLAQAGLGSRRACEELIAAGRVSVDGEVARLGRRVNPASAVVRVDGERLAVRPGAVYLALNKPRGVLSAMSDARGRPCVGGPGRRRRPQRLFHVGRLDADTEGLLLLTNDGELAHRLAHPSYGVAKRYLAEVPGPVTAGVGRRLRAGVELEDGPAKVDRFRVMATQGSRAQVELEIHEGRNHIVRRMLAEVGHPVTRLVRLRQGPVALGDLRVGRTRALNRAEVAALYAVVDL